MSASQNYHATVLVLKKTKLGESDLILTMLAGDGSLVKAVAKGARKPTSSFANRLELFCESEVMLVRGRNLDIAREVRLLNSHDALRGNVAATYAASPILDCIAQSALPDLPLPHLFAMASSALAHIDRAAEPHMPAFTAAFLVKLFALLGVRPQLSTCVACGAARSVQGDEHVRFSFADGGYVCDSCAHTADTVVVPAGVLQWAEVLLLSTFDDVEALAVDPGVSFDVLHFAHQWLRETQHVNSKALNALLTCGLF